MKMKKEEVLAALDRILDTFQGRALELLRSWCRSEADGVTIPSGPFPPTDFDEEYFRLVIQSFHEAFVNAFHARVDAINDLRRCFRNLQNEGVCEFFFATIYLQPLVDLLQFCRSRSPRSQTRTPKPGRTDRQFLRLLGFAAAFRVVAVAQHHLAESVLRFGAVPRKSVPRTKAELLHGGLASAMELVALDLQWLFEEEVAHLCLPILARAQSGQASGMERRWIAMVFNPYPPEVGPKIVIEGKKKRGRPVRDALAQNVFDSFRRAGVLGQVAGRRTWGGPADPASFENEARARMRAFGVQVGSCHDFKKTFVYGRNTEWWANYQSQCEEFMDTRLAALFDDVLFPEPADGETAASDVGEAVARLKLREAKALADAFAAMKIPSTSSPTALKKALRDKLLTQMKAVVTFIEVYRVGFPDLTTEALCRVALLYETFVRELDDYRVPKHLRHRMTPVINEFLMPAKSAAREAFQDAVKFAKSKNVDTVWSRMAKMHLQEAPSSAGACRRSEG
jgi:hypothetical protein